MANRVATTLLDMAAEMERRHLKPVVAWDCMAAQTWATKYSDLAASVQELSEPEAIALLVQKRDGIHEPDGGMGWYVAMDAERLLSAALARANEALKG